MDVHNLVHMANRIGDFFQAMPDREEAVEGIAEHLRKFWEPRMRRLMLEHVDQAGTAALHPLMAQAVQEQRASLL
ncbi:formate dehydrogenase subunit delta [Azohydromonas australica]|uniref:formate dehydrogenase subunit delta n=1 Tax=Azohydromonas australica TaxID=364039 RepID=UPI0003F5E6F5|nr:formate dehydrogenase subunit delta [Azohydromonas australica]